VRGGSDCMGDCVRVEAVWRAAVGRTEGAGIAEHTQMRGGNRDAASSESANQVYCEVRARALVALILVGRAYEQIARRVDRKKFSQVGRSVALLHAGSVPPPYVLVGASGLGGSDPSPVEQTSGHSGRPPCVQRLQCSGVCREASVRSCRRRCSWIRRTRIKDVTNQELLGRM
jgi:hypothetical protein